MKNIIWITISAAIITTVAWLYNFIHTFKEALLLVAGCGLMIALSAAIGYYLISFLDKKEKNNIIIVVLIPWVPMFLLWLIIFLFVPALGFVLMGLAPFLLIASSVGGVLAHKKRLKQIVQNTL